MMRGKRRNPNENKARSKKIKRSKAFWQQRKTNTISQVQDSESGSELEDINTDVEPTTQYQKLLETYSHNAVSSEKLVSDSENEDDSELDSEAGNPLIPITISYLRFLNNYNRIKFLPPI